MFFGIKNIEYLQGDILDLGKLQKKFDLIESSGVLHHMEDPFKGLKTTGEKKIHSSCIRSSSSKFPRRKECQFLIAFSIIFLPNQFLSLLCSSINLTASLRDFLASGMKAKSGYTCHSPSAISISTSTPALEAKSSSRSESDKSNS